MLVSQNFELPVLSSSTDKYLIPSLNVLIHLVSVAFY